MASSRVSPTTRSPSVSVPSSLENSEPVSMSDSCWLPMTSTRGGCIFGGGLAWMLVLVSELAGGDWCVMSSGEASISVGVTEGES